MLPFPTASCACGRGVFFLEKGGGRRKALSCPLSPSGRDRYITERKCLLSVLFTQQCYCPLSGETKMMTFCKIGEDGKNQWTSRPRKYDCWYMFRICKKVCHSVLWDIFICIVLISTGVLICFCGGLSLRLCLVYLWESLRLVIIYKDTWEVLSYGPGNMPSERFLQRKMHLSNKPSFLLNCENFSLIWIIISKVF